MALWDGETLWDGSDTWGFTDPPASVITLRNILGAGIPKRVGCFEVWSVDPDTLVFAEKLPLRANEGNRRVNGRLRIQEDNLEFALNDTTGRYLPGGDLHYLVDVNSLVGLKWTVGTSLVSPLTYYGNVYRIVDPPDRGRTVKGLSAFTVNAEGWLKALFDRSIVYTPAAGLSPLQVAVVLKDAMVALGSPVIESVNSFATITAAMIYYLAGNRCLVTESWHTAEAPEVGSETFLQWGFTDPLRGEITGRAPSWGTVLDWLLWYSRSRMVYRGDGVPHLRESRKRIDSGLVISCDPDYPAIVRIPWEEPITRQITRPEFTAYSYYLTNLLENVGGGTSVSVQLLASKVSHAINNPHTDPAGRGRNENARGNFVHSAVDQTAAMYVEDRLQQVLADADTVTVNVDNAFPISNYITDDVQIRLPDDGIDGWFRLNEIQQPLNEHAATVILNWLSD